MKAPKFFKHLTTAISALFFAISVSFSPLLHSENSSITDRQKIEILAEEFVKKQYPVPESGDITIKSVPLDRRIRIKPCKSDLSLSIAGNRGISRQTTVQIRCNDESSWNLYVQVRITEMQNVVVAKSHISPGTVMTEEILSVVLKDKAQIRGYTLDNPSIIIGAKSSRHIANGQIVTTKHVCMVCKGESVTIIANVDGLTVQTTGIAQENGSIGDTIAVLNKRSNRRIDARVVSVNQVLVNM